MEIISNSSVIRSLASYKIVPVVVLDDAQDANSLGDALVAGGLPIAEVTLRTPAALGAMRILSERGDVLVGAGTVTSARQVDAAKEAGAEFIVSPGFHESVVKRCLELDLAILPGVSSASDIAKTMDFGLSAVKFFPAEASGGVKLLKALAAPYHEMKFVPTGGINVDNIADYLAVSAVLACGGSWMVDRKLVQQADFETIKNLTKEVVERVNQ